MSVSKTFLVTWSVCLLVLIVWPAQVESAEIQLLRDTSLQTVINDDATLADATRAAGDLDNNTELDLGADCFLQVQWDGTAPTAGDKIAELYVLPEDGAGVFAEGGDAGLGTDDNPQQIFLVGVFESINPSITVNEILAIPGIPLYGHDNRFVLLNTSGQTFDLTWQLTCKPYKLNSP